MEALETLFGNCKEMVSMTEKLKDVVHDLTEETLPKYMPLFSEMGKFFIDKAVNYLANEEAAFFPVFGTVIGRKPLQKLLKEHEELYKAFNRFTTGLKHKSVPDIAAAAITVMRIVPPHVTYEMGEIYPQAKQKFSKDDWEEVKKKLRA